MSNNVFSLHNIYTGSGKEIITFNLAWMLSELGKRVVLIELNPNSNMSSLFFDDEKLYSMFNDSRPNTVFKCVKPLLLLKEIHSPQLQKINDNLYFLPSDICLHEFSDYLSIQWHSFAGQNTYYAMKILSSLNNIIKKSNELVNADIILLDLPADFGSITRTGIISTNYLINILFNAAYDKFYIKSLNDMLECWKKSWKHRLFIWENQICDDRVVGKEIPIDFTLVPKCNISELGYCLNKQYKKIDVNTKNIPILPTLGILNNYKILPVISRAHKIPIFKLNSEHGITSSELSLVEKSYIEYKNLAQNILQFSGIL